MEPVDTDDDATQQAWRTETFQSARRKLDPIDGPRALGAKRSALQAQRRRHDVTNQHVGLLRTRDDERACVLISSSGLVAFAIRRTGSGLFVEKRYCPPTGVRTSIAMIFESQSAFERWCHLEPTRFHDPILCDELSCRGRELFASHS
ncbi:hypothetical protein ACG02S_25215 [Roseateles sp. DC23W]|uniref:Uncharacterized protein n=1 Tax=Pelomonas dachongensis TaxID=3299029 RepID=A0ABW7EYB3_9BURK